MDTVMEEAVSALPEDDKASRKQFGSFRKTEKSASKKEKADLYRTHPWVSRSILAREFFEGQVWECACGRGDLDRELRLLGYDTIASDLFDHGYGEAGRNFLKASHYPYNIMTNPPYNIGTKFIRHAIEIADGKLVFIVKLSFLEGAGRFCEIYYETPPNRIHVFSERPTFVESEEGLWPEMNEDYESWLASKGSMAGTMALVWEKRDLRRKAGESADTFWISPGEKPNSKFRKRIRKMEASHNRPIMHDLELKGPFFQSSPENRIDSGSLDLRHE